MNKLVKNGVIKVSNHRDEEDELITGKDLLGVLRDQIEIGENDSITLRDLFRIFEPIKDFISAYSSIDYDAYLAELNKPIDWVKKESCPIDHIAIKWTAEYWKEYNEFNTGVDACGVDSSVPVDQHGTWEEGAEHSKSRYWAIDAQSMNSLADMPIKLDSKFNIMNFDDGKYIAQSWDRKFSLLDVVDAIFYEVSYFGLPEDRDAFMGMLGDRLEAVKNMTDEEKKTRLIPLEDVMKRLEDIKNEDGNGSV